ncbi:MAG TPA: ABC transporter ATP-binding protein [Polyangiaceae bacterium]|nr:ABC transporter ATP-binding protein [Polyangiaceae bacterium]
MSSVLTVAVALLAGAGEFAVAVAVVVAVGFAVVVALATGAGAGTPAPPAVLASPAPFDGVHAARASTADNSGPLIRCFVLQGETTTMITVEGLYKSYSGSSFAVRDVSFRVKKGEIVGFLGPNGAGKSTTLRVVAGFLGATAGRVTLAGHDIADAPTEARAAVGYMPESVPLYPEMRVREYLAFRAELKRVPRKRRRDAVDSAMRRARVHGVADKVIGHLSKGYRQRVGLADALVADPPILVLDEPTAGLDPNQIREVRALVRELGKDHAVLVSTHILPEVEATCDRALVISKGVLVAEGTIEELHKLSHSRGVRITVSGSGEVARALATNADVEQVTRVGKMTHLVTWHPHVADAERAAEEVARTLISSGFGLRELSPVKASLEQVFAELTGETAR